MISAALFRLWEWLTPRIALFGGIIMLILTALFYARKAGEKAEKVESLRQTLKMTKAKNDIQTDINTLPTGAAADELYKHYSRD